MEENNVNIEPQAQGLGETAGTGQASTPPEWLGSFSTKYGQEFNSPDSVYEFFDGKVSEAQKAIEGFNQIKESWDSLPQHIRYFNDLQRENPGMSDKDIMQRMVNDLSESMTDYSELSKSNPREVVVRGLMRERGLERVLAEREATRIEKKILSEASSEGDDEESINKLFNDDYRIEAAKYLKTLEASKPKFSAREADPQAIAQHNARVEAFRSSLANTAKAPFEINVNGSKVAIPVPDEVGGVIAAALKSESPADSLLGHINSFIVNKDGTYNVSGMVRMLNLMHGGDALYGKILATAKSEAIKNQDAALSNSGGGTGGNGTSAPYSSLADVYSRR